MKRTARKVVTGEGGSSRFDETEIEFHRIEGLVPGGVFDAAPLGPNDVALVQFAPGFVADWHNTPAPTWMFVLQGRMSLGLSDDAWWEMGPGDMVLMTDSDGVGHRSRVLGDEDVVMATAGYGG